MILYRHSNKNNRAAIDVFFVPQACHGVARQSEEWSRDKKVCVRLRTSAVKKKSNEIFLSKMVHFLNTTKVSALE